MKHLKKFEGFDSNEIINKIIDETYQDWLLDKSEAFSNQIVRTAFSPGFYNTSNIKLCEVKFKDYPEVLSKIKDTLKSK